jgi:hypothetical protein
MNKIKPNKEHILKLIDFLFNEVISSGGDGDALWYSHYYELDDIKPLLEEYNSKHNLNWEIKHDALDILNWGKDQEWITITTDKKVADFAPDWAQIKIYY